MQSGTENSAKGKNKKFGVVLIVVLLIAGIGAFFIYQHAIHHETTDNAQVEANISPVIPRVSGFVQKVYVTDNQYVKTGDTLLVLDDNDYVVRLRVAEAALAAAKSNLEVARQGVDVSKNQINYAKAGILAADASIESAKVRQWRAEKDFERYENLWKSHTVTQQQYEQALAEKQEADRQLEYLQKQKTIAQRQSQTTTAEGSRTDTEVSVAEANVKQQEATLEEARLNLSYTVILAKYDGQLSEIDIKPGQFVQAGQTLFNEVDVNECWVVANYKETQLGKMKVGQEVEMEVDAVPGHTFEGVVSSFAPASGDKMAILPADNATGNFVKVVQKLPVKIIFKDKNDEYLKRLKAGMNVDVDVHID